MKRDDSFSKEKARTLAAVFSPIPSMAAIVSTVKPLDRETLLASVEKTGVVVTAEEHQIVNGLGSAVCELLAELKAHITPLRGSKLWQIALLERWLQQHGIGA